MTGLAAFLLPAVPLLALLVFLLFGRYPGCEAIVRLSERLAAPGHRRRRAPVASPRPRAPRSFAPGGGLLLALGIAQRPPPARA